MPSIRFLFAIFVSLLFSSALFAQCPTLVVTGPAGLTYPGDEMLFRVEIGALGPKFEYEWTVSAGTIVMGQGTTSVNVLTDKSIDGANITATVSVKGLSANCASVASATAPLMPTFGCQMPLDEYGDLKPNDVRARIDTFFAELENNPTNTGFVILTVTHKERLDAQNKRLQLWVKHAKFRNFDLGRLTFTLELFEEGRTKLYRVPPGAEAPTCDGGCQILKGSDL